jgi:nitroreductase
MEAIYKRRSIRKYKPDPVEKEKVDALIKAATYAPSSNNRQPWVFLVCDERSAVDSVRATHPYSSMLAEAPLAILVCADLNVYPKDAVSDIYKLDCAAAVQNILLEAYDLGLGTCWLGGSPYEKRMTDLAVLFHLPSNIVVHSVIAVGYPDEVKEASRKAPIVHYNKF